MKSLFRNLAVSALVALFFSGCAGERMFNDGKELITSGKHEEGLSKIEAAIKENPASYEYQVYLKNRKEALIFGALAHAEEARSQGMLTEAEAA